LTKAVSKGVIHVIDDEINIVSMASGALERDGYQVHSFTNTSIALDDIETTCRQMVSMIITDIRMPCHNGFEIARKTRAIVPEVPIIFMTVFEINLSEFNAVFPSLKGANLLQKPFHIDQLLEIVRKYES
jgi:DNA-binding NtrC family response regulator